MATNVWMAVGTGESTDDEKSVQACIKRGLTHLSLKDQKAFQKKFREQAGDEHQVMHTFRELLAGVFIAQQGFSPSYEPEIDGLTPDWLFQKGSQRGLIGDVVNFH